MTMKIIPAIDLQDGECVRLYQGNFDKRTTYRNDPIAVACEYHAMGFDSLHIVDLDGAQCGRQQNRDIISAIASGSDTLIQLGGGIRNRESVSSWLAAGVSRCVIGSLAIDEPRTIRTWIDEFGPDHIVLALDVRLADNDVPLLTTHGWTKSPGIDLWRYLDEHLENDIRHVLCTDVSRDGTMSGPNLDLYRELIERYPNIDLQASGGVRDADDLRMLDDLGASVAITGRALLDGKINPKEMGQFLRVA